MATDQALADVKTIISINQGLSRLVANLKISFENLKEFKEEVLDDPERRAELKELIDVWPDWSMNKITTSHKEYKAIYDYLKELE